MSNAAHDILNLTATDFDAIVDADQSGREFEVIDGKMVASDPNETAVLFASWSNGTEAVRGAL